MPTANNPNISGTNQANASRQRGLGRTLFWLTVIVLAVLALWRPLKGLYGPIGAPAYRGMNHASFQELEQHMTEAADWLLFRINATEEQREQMQEIQNNLLPTLSAIQNEHHILRDQIKLTLDTDPVKREELERIRTASLDLADRASLQVVDSFVQMLEVLTLEQRAELPEMWRWRR